MCLVDLDDTKGKKAHSKAVEKLMQLKGRKSGKNFILDF